MKIHMLGMVLLAVCICFPSVAMGASAKVYDELGRLIDPADGRFLEETEERSEDTEEIMLSTFEEAQALNEILEEEEKQAN